MSVQLFIRDIQFMSQVEIEPKQLLFFDTEIYVTQHSSILVTMSLSGPGFQFLRRRRRLEKLRETASTFSDWTSSAFLFQDLLNPGEPEKILEISEFSMLRCAKHFYNVNAKSFNSNKKHHQQITC